MVEENQKKNVCRKCKHYNFNTNNFICKENGKILEFSNAELECPKSYWEDNKVPKKDRYG